MGCASGPAGPGEDENFESLKLKYQNFRDFLLILLRIIATKFNNFQHREDQNLILRVFCYIVKQLQDYDIKIEVINLLKCLFLGEKGFRGGVLPKRYERVKMANYTPERVMEYFFEVGNLQKMFDAKTAPYYESQLTLGARLSEERI